MLIFVFSVSPCVSVTCLNEGTCVVDAGLALCVCKGNYSGSDCAGKNKLFTILLTFTHISLSINQNIGTGAIIVMIYGS